MNETIAAVQEVYTKQMFSEEQNETLWQALCSKNEQL